MPGRIRYGPKAQPPHAPPQLGQLLDEFAALLDEHAEQWSAPERDLARKVARYLDTRRRTLRAVHGGTRVA